jgi:hypothetical protein
VLTAGDRAASSSSHILGGLVNDLKTTFRDGIAVEGAIVRVEAPIGRPLDAQTLHEIDRLNFTLRDLTRHAHCLASGRFLIRGSDPRALNVSTPQNADALSAGAAEQ